MDASDPRGTPAHAKAAAGTLTCARGAIPFGPGCPTLLVNDQMGYSYGRPEVLAELREGNLNSLIELARAGQAVGIQVVNVQLMEPTLDELDLVPRVVRALHEATGCAIAVDSRKPEVVERGLAAYPHKALCNSISGEMAVLEAMLPVAARYGAAVTGSLVYEKGVPMTVEERLHLGRRIVRAAEAHGIPRQDVILDAVCLPSAVQPDTMRTTLETLAAFHRELGVATLLGISNAGFLMPEPEKVDLAYLIAAVAWGLDVAMVNPATPLLAEEIRAVDFLLGKDPYAKGYLSLYRARRKQRQRGVNPDVASAHCAGEGRERY